MHQRGKNKFFDILNKQKTIQKRQLGFCAYYFVHLMNTYYFSFYESCSFPEGYFAFYFFISNLLLIRIVPSACLLLFVAALLSHAMLIPNIERTSGESSAYENFHSTPLTINFKTFKILKLMFFSAVISLK